MQIPELDLPGQLAVDKQNSMSQSNISATFSNLDHSLGSNFRPSDASNSNLS